MKNKILMTMIVSVLTSLSCMATPPEVALGPGYLYYKLHFDSAGNTAAIVGEDYGDPKYGYYMEHIVLGPIQGIKSESGRGNFLIIAVENLTLSGDESLAKYNGLSDKTVTKTIKLPSSVKTIGDLAITNNSNLYLVEMPGVQTMGKEALSNNPSISELIELRELEYLGERAFAGCKKLPEIRFGPNLRFIGKDAFEGCESLKIVDIWNPNTWSRVEFETETANPITLTKTFNLNGTEVHHLDFDAHDTHVAPYSFNSAENLNSVRIRNASSIGESAFDKCLNLSDICLDVDSIGNYTFANNASVRRVYVMTGNPPKANPTTFYDYSNAKLYVPNGSLEEYRNTPHCWSLFRNIEESDFSDIDDIFMADYDPVSVEDIEREEREEDNAIDPTKPLEVYTMQGQLISRSTDALQPGLYILRQGQKAKKILIGHH